MSQKSGFLSVQRESALLRAITYRISTTPAAQLPRCTRQIAGSISNCSSILSLAADDAKANLEAVNSAQRFRTTLTHLLQDRSVEGRWAAVILVKAAVEAGGLEVVTKSSAWIKHLVSILKKPDPPSTRTLAVITLTRIFTLTAGLPTLVRELTTPNLPIFVSICLYNISHVRCSSSELLSVLQSFIVLLPRHPTIFRTAEGQLRSFLIQIIGTTSLEDDKSKIYSTEQVDSATRLLILLHHCAPKQTGPEKWVYTLRSTVALAKATCDVIFRSIIENHGFAPTVRGSIDVQPNGGRKQPESNQDLAFPQWGGINAGTSHLKTLLYMIQMHFRGSTADTVAIEVGLIVQVLTRVLSITTPSSSGSSSLQVNNQIAKDERDALYEALPSIHARAFEVVGEMVAALGLASIGLIPHILGLVPAVFNAERFDTDLRQAIFSIIADILKIFGLALPAESFMDVVPIVWACCEELSGKHEASKSQAQITGNGVSKDNANPVIPLFIRDKSYEAARSLLPLAISKLDPAKVKPKLRTELERVAILTGHNEAVLACVINPFKRVQKPHPSLLPILARADSSNVAVEALLRPRMPPIAIRTSNGNTANSDDEVEDNGVSHSMQTPSLTMIPDLPLSAGQSDILIAGSMNAEESATTSDSVPSITNSHGVSSAKSHEFQDNGALGIHSTLNKREAPDQAAMDIIPKKQRASPDDGTAERSMVNQMESGYGTAAIVDQQDSTSSKLEVESATMMDGSFNDQRTNLYDTEDAQSDLSGFETPPLTMELDTDPEDE